MVLPSHFSEFAGSVTSDNTLHNLSSSLVFTLRKGKQYFVTTLDTAVVNNSGVGNGESLDGR